MVQVSTNLLTPVEEVYPWEDGLNLKHSLRKPCTIWKDEEDGKTPKKKLRVAKKYWWNLHLMTASHPVTTILVKLQLLEITFRFHTELLRV